MHKCNHALPSAFYHFQILSGDAPLDHERPESLPVAGCGVPGRGEAHRGAERRCACPQWSGEGENTAAPSSPGRDGHRSCREGVGKEFTMCTFLICSVMCIVRVVSGPAEFGRPGSCLVAELFSCKLALPLVYENTARS